MRLRGRKGARGDAAGGSWDQSTLTHPHLRCAPHRINFKAIVRCAMCTCLVQSPDLWRRLTKPLIAFIPGLFANLVQNIIKSIWRRSIIVRIPSYSSNFCPCFIDRSSCSLLLLRARTAARICDRMASTTLCSFSEDDPSVAYCFLQQACDWNLVDMLAWIRNLAVLLFCSFFFFPVSDLLNSAALL